MVAGRPRKYDYEKEAKDLLEWSLKEDSYNILAFVNPKEYTFNTMLRFIEGSEAFAEAFQKAYQRCAQRREKMLNQKKLNYGIWERYADLYDPSLALHEELKETRKAKLRAQEQEQIDENYLKKFDAHMEMMREKQSQSKSSRNNTDSKINKDSNS